MNMFCDPGTPGERPDHATARAVIVAIGLGVGGLVAGLIGVVGFGTLKGAIGVAGTPLGEALGGGIQAGFAAVGMVFLALTDDLRQYVRIRRPTPEDVGWILVSPILIAATGPVTLVAESLLGVSSEPHTGSAGLLDVGVVLAEQPVAWALVIGWLFLFAAPMEELLYRGIIQGHVRPHVGAVGTVFVGTVAFGLIHALPALFGGVDSAVLAFLNTGIGGVVWGVAYERTGNLAVTAVSHASMWVVNYEVLLPLAWVGPTRGPKGARRSTETLLTPVILGFHELEFVPDRLPQFGQGGLLVAPDASARFAHAPTIPRTASPCAML
ncbi:CPBP family intramembrane glutamic endopeptidase [Halorubrum sp. 2020YC2]|uniref:CPBP family intramembrane glutamic endopeptidase n=1 Tax=Halorubrum sp. 2020YC2 TaxID=2836432 RepID=UPI001BE56409|nr:CPBP family intramembrane glutamic endopeptidase [Halorubrum sp. 2020YC2]QWC18454.1 CPBP family intramembrane metalloprotease [Halorubrum sp. 2020YC2]